MIPPIFFRMPNFYDNLVFDQLIGDALRARYEFKNGKKIKSENNNSDNTPSKCGILNPNTAITITSLFFFFRD